jgi:hypothetical protein
VLTLDDLILAGTEPGRQAHSIEWGVALDDCQGDRAKLVVTRHRRQGADDPAVHLHRYAALGQDVTGTVEVQEDQPTRRPPKVVNASHALLPAIAPLVQVNGRAQRRA